MSDNPASPDISALVCCQYKEHTQIIREYLHTWGCSVYESESTDVQPTYTIYCGNREFVKSFLAQLKFYSKKTLVICLGNESIEKQYTEHSQVRLVYLDSDADLSVFIHDIFSFYITGNNTVLYLKNSSFHSDSDHESEIYKKKSDLRTVHVNQPESVSRPEDQSQDMQRIKKVIEEIYGNILPTKNHVIKKYIFPFRIQPIVFLVFLTTAYILLYISSLAFSAGFISGSVMFLNKGAYRYAKICSLASKISVFNSRLLLFIAQWPFLPLGSHQFVRVNEQYVQLIEDAHTVVSDGVLLEESFQNFLNGVTQQLEGNTQTQYSLPATADAIVLQLASMDLKLGIVHSELSYFQSRNMFPFSIRTFSSKSSLFVDAIESTRSDVNDMRNIVSLYKLMGGFDKPKMYLILFQNSAELRPTGGFIGSYGLMQIDSGRLKGLTIEDVYTADGQLVGHVDPPDPIRELLNQEHWYMRDSNWDPDFAKSGEKAAWFFEKETGQNVDGVIAFSTPFIIDLLKATGPLTLDDFNDTISAENFFGKALYYTEQSFFPGSTQKKDFLTVFQKKLLDRLMNGSDLSPLHIGRFVKKGLYSKDIQMYSREKQIQEAVRTYGWGGIVDNSLRCFGIAHSDGCFVDSISPVEANMSISKVNTFVTRNMTSRINIQESGSISHTHTMLFHNSSSSGKSKSGGVYRNYLRFYLPGDSSISGVAVDGRPALLRDQGSQLLPSVPYMEIPKEKSPSGLTVIAVVFDVLPQSETLVSISYVRGKPFGISGGDGRYRLTYVKQAGISDTPIDVSLTYPAGWTPTFNNALPPSVANGSRVQYNMTLTRDMTVDITFEK